MPSMQFWIPLVLAADDEIVAAAGDVAEMDVEDLLAAAEIADHVEQLGLGVHQVFRHRALAEIEAVIRVFIHGDEALHAVDGAQLLRSS